MSGTTRYGVRRLLFGLRFLFIDLLVVYVVCLLHFIRDLGKPQVPQTYKGKTLLAEPAFLKLGEHLLALCPPGRALSIAFEGRVVMQIYTGAFINRVSHGETPVQASTLFPCFSLGKAVCALVLLKLHDLGKFNYSDSARLHLPSLHEDYQDRTIHDFLSHRAGVEPVYPLWLVAQYVLIPVLLLKKDLAYVRELVYAQGVRWFLHQSRPLFPEKKEVYGVTGFAWVAAAFGAHLSGQPLSAHNYNQCLEDLLYDPSAPEEVYLGNLSPDIEKRVSQFRGSPFGQKSKSWLAAFFHTFESYLFGRTANTNLALQLCFPSSTCFATTNGLALLFQKVFHSKDQAQGQGEFWGEVSGFRGQYFNGFRISTGEDLMIEHNGSGGSYLGVHLDYRYSLATAGVDYQSLAQGGMSVENNPLIKEIKQVTASFFRQLRVVQ